MRKAFIAAIWLMLWWGLSLWMKNDILLATPPRVIVRLMELLAEGAVLSAAGTTLGRIALGFFTGCVIAIVLATLSAKWSFAEEMFSPIISLLTAVPVASFAVLLLIWWGSSFLAVAISFLMVLPAVYVATLQGIRSVDPKLLEMARVFRMPLWNRLFYLYRPSVKPFLTSSLKVSLGMSWKSGVAAELIGVPEHSLGEQLYLSKVYLDTPGVFAWTAVVVLLSFCFERMILFALNRFFAWQPDCRAAANVKLGEHPVGVGIRNLQKSFNGKPLFSIEECALQSGQVYLLNAPSGAGKTTFLHILAGLGSYTGTIGIYTEKAGEPDNSTAAKTLWEKPVTNRCPICSVCFQEDRLCEELSAVKNVALVLGDEKRAREALSAVLPGEALDKPCAKLSGGMRRRVALVRAMEVPSEVILLDEPYNGLDRATRDKVKNYIHIKQRGRMILLASHDTEREGHPSRAEDR